MRQWTAGALAAQKQIAARLSREGIQLVPDFVYTRTFNGFAAPIDGRALALLERDPDVFGVYPVRAAYPAALSAAELQSPAFGPGGGRRAEVGIPRFDGSGITVALLDTGVDVTHPFIRDRLLDGIDMLDPERRGIARAHPDEPTRLERHGTQLAGLIAGRGGPGGIRGVVPSARILPIRVAGWQPSAEGGFAVYGRTDQLLAGIERAVDPDADGDVLDAARVAVVGVTEPFASFPDGPIARAIEGAARLDTLVVVPAGNEGPAGPSYGSIGGPGGAPDALTVAAADFRNDTATVRVVVRAGLHVLLDRQVAARRRCCAEGAAGAHGRTASPRRGERPTRHAAGPLLRRPGLQPGSGSRDVALTGGGADRRGPLGRPRRRGGDPRGRRRACGSARPRRSSRRPSDRDPPRGRGRAAVRPRPRQRGERLAGCTRLADERAPGRDRAVLLAGPRVRRRDQARACRPGRRARHRRPRPERPSHRPLRHDQRHERCDRARRRRGRRACAGPSGARRSCVEGRARGNERPGPREPGRGAGRRHARPAGRRGGRGGGRARDRRLRLGRQGGLERRPQDLAPKCLLPPRHDRRRRRDGADRGPLGHRVARPRPPRTRRQRAGEADRALGVPAPSRRRDSGPGSARGLRRRRAPSSRGRSRSPSGARR